MHFNQLETPIIRRRRRLRAQFPCRFHGARACKTGKTGELIKFAAKSARISEISKMYKTLVPTENAAPPAAKSLKSQSRTAHRRQHAHTHTHKKRRISNNTRRQAHTPMRPHVHRALAANSRSARPQRHSRIPAHIAHAYTHTDTRRTRAHRHSPYSRMRLQSARVRARARPKRINCIRMAAKSKSSRHLRRPSPTQPIVTRSGALAHTYTYARCKRPRRCGVGVDDDDDYDNDDIDDIDDDNGRRARARFATRCWDDDNDNDDDGR